MPTYSSKNIEGTFFSLPQVIKVHLKDQKCFHISHEPLSILSASECFPTGFN